MAGIEVEVKGLKEALQHLRDTQQARGLGNLVGNVIVRGVKRTFERGQDPDTGEKWKPIKNRHGQPLRDLGRLMRSIHYEKTGDGFDTKVSVGTNLIYAATHQFGDPHRVPVNAKRLVFQVMGVTVFAKKVSIPRRKYLPETDQGLFRATNGLLAPAVEKFLKKAWS